MKFLNLIFVLIFSINNLHASYIQYSGISYISQNKDIVNIFGNSLKLESSLRGLLYEHLDSNNSLNPYLKLGVSETFKDGSYSIIVALENESISSIYLNRIGSDDKCQRTFSLSTQTIIFNTQDQQIVSIKPNAARRLHFDDPKDGSCDYRNKKVELLRFAEMFYGLEIQKKDYESYLIKDDDEMIEMIKNKSKESNLYTSDKSVLTNVINEILSADLSILSNTNFFVGVDDVVLSEYVSDQMSGKKINMHVVRPTSLPLFYISYGAYSKHLCPGSRVKKDTGKFSRNSKTSSPRPRQYHARSDPGIYNVIAVHVTHVTNNT